MTQPMQADSPVNHVLSIVSIAQDDLEGDNTQIY